MRNNSNCNSHPFLSLALADTLIQTLIQYLDPGTLQPNEPEHPQDNSNPLLLKLGLGAAHRMVLRLGEQQERV